MFLANVIGSEMSGGRYDIPCDSIEMKVDTSLNRNLCVLGVMDNIKGRDIEKELLEWLVERYDVYSVVHNGKMFEYPALKFASLLSQYTGRPVLYIHTKGAVYDRVRTPKIRRMWRHEFIDNIETYFSKTNSILPKVAAPFTGSDNVTWYNAFVANSQAFRLLGNIKVTDDRFYYERMFKYAGINVEGIIMYNVDTGRKRPMHEYIDTYYT